MKKIITLSVLCLALGFLIFSIYKAHQLNQVGIKAIKYQETAGAVMNVSNCSDEPTLPEQIACLTSEYAPTSDETSFEDALLGLGGENNLGATASSILDSYSKLGRHCYNDGENCVISKAEFLGHIWEKKLGACSAILETGCDVIFNGKPIYPSFNWNNISLTDYANILSQANTQISNAIEGQMGKASLGSQEPKTVEVPPTIRTTEPIKKNPLLLLLPAGLILLFWGELKLIKVL